MIERETQHQQFLTHFLPARGVIRAFLYAATRNAADTDDLFQQVGGVVWRKFDQFDATRPFAAWAIGIARMEVLKWRERMVRGSKLRSLSDEAVAALADAAAAEPDISQPDDRTAALKICLERLAPKVREAVQMKYRDGQPIKTIATSQRREVGAVEMTLVRARRALKLCIEERMRTTGGDRPASPPANGKD